MSFALDPRQSPSIERAIHDALSEQLGFAADVLFGAQPAGEATAAAAASRTRPSPSAEAVHEARKSMKRVRSTLRLLVPGLGKKVVRAETKRLAQTARYLAAARDGRILHDALERLAQAATEGEAAALQAARKARGVLPVPEVPADLVEQVVGELTEARERIARHTLGRSLGSGVERVLQAGLCGLVREIRSAHAAATDEPSVESFHTLRKRCKDLFYSVRLLGDLGGELLAPLIKDLDRTGEALGEEHDLALLAEQVHSQPLDWGGADSAAQLAELIERERVRLRLEARPLVERLVMLSPRRFARLVVAQLRESWNRQRAALPPETPA